MAMLNSFPHLFLAIHAAGMEVAQVRSGMKIAIQILSVGLAIALGILAALTDALAASKNAF